MLIDAPLNPKIYLPYIDCGDTVRGDAGVESSTLQNPIPPLLLVPDMIELKDQGQALIETGEGLLRAGMNVIPFLRAWREPPIKQGSFCKLGVRNSHRSLTIQ